MQWEATDQFGNLYVMTSTAVGIDELRPQLESLIEQLRVRTGGAPFTVTVDTEYGEINGPDPNGVSHVIRCGWVEGLPAEQAQDVLDALQEACAAQGVADATIQLA